MWSMKSNAFFFQNRKLNQLTGSATLKNHFVHNIIFIIAEHVSGKDNTSKKIQCPKSLNNIFLNANNALIFNSFRALKKEAVHTYKWWCWLLLQND